MPWCWRKVISCLNFMCSCVTLISIFSLCCGRLGALQRGGPLSTSKLALWVHSWFCVWHIEECILGCASEVGHRTLNSLGHLSVLAFKITLSYVYRHTSRMKHMNKTRIVAQLVGCLHSIQEALGLILTPHTWGMVASVKLALGRQRSSKSFWLYEFLASLGYMGIVESKVYNGKNIILFYIPKGVFNPCPLVVTFSTNGNFLILFCFTFTSPVPRLQV